MPEYEVPWIERLTNWGYVTFRVDSFGPRGESSVCTKLLAVAPWTRAQDAHDAKSYLATLPFVEGNKIAVMGSGTGGWATLYSVNKGTSFQERGNPFRAAVALYPYCHLPEFESDAPVLILIGEFSGWFPAEKCLDIANTKGAASDVTLKIYPGTYMHFDFEEGEKIWHVEDRQVKYNPEAATDAIARVKNFLSKNLK
jgi:dienelactone hydrolase